MVVVDGQGIPLACGTSSASPAEVTLAEGVLEEVATSDTPTPLIADKAYDSGALRKRLGKKGWDLICPHRKNRSQTKLQDGRKLRRYRRRWKVERTISWLQQFRRLIVRHEYYGHLYQAFVHLACITICLRRF